MSQIGLVSSIQNLEQKVTQAEAVVQKTTDLVNAALSPNGIKIPSVPSLKSLLGSLPTGFSTISAVASSFAAVSQLPAKVSGLGGFLNSAIGTAQNLGGAIQGVVGVSSALGIDIGALGGLSQKILGVDPTNHPVGQTASFNMTPTFNWEIKSDNGDAALVYPPDLNIGQMECIQFSIKEYEKGQITQKAKYNPKASIFLPIPQNLNESYSPQWSTFSPGPIRALQNELLGAVKLAATSATGNTAENFSMFANATKDFLNDLYTGVSDYATSGRSEDEKTAGIASIGQMAVWASGYAETSAGQTLANFTGRVVNPYTTVSFQGVGLRQHFFSWVIAPKTPDESALIERIFYVLKKSALPKSMQGVFMEYPKVVSVRFQPDEGNLYNFKPCIIDGISINHAGSGQPSFFNETGKPTIYTLSLSLREIEMYTADDVSNGSNKTSEEIGQTTIKQWNSKTFMNDDTTTENDVAAFFRGQ